MNRLIRVLCDDGVELQGFLSEAGKVGTAVLHIHGSCGNFYENVFIDNMTKAYADVGVAFLSLNTRGHDYYADIKMVTGEGVKWVVGGGVYEIFEDAQRDIQAAIAFLNGLGYSRIVLQGHSLGAMKAAYVSNIEKIDSLILLAPPDSFASQRSHLGTNYASVLALALSMVRDGKGRELMPENVYEHKISAESYVSKFGSEVADVFSFSRNSGFDGLRENGTKVFIAIGENDEYLQQPVAQVVEWFHKRLPECIVSVIPEAGHGFQGCEEQLALDLSKWVNEHHSR